MNDKQDRFAEEFIVDLNATKAAERTGYSKKTARSQGQRLLTNVDIQEAIQKAIQERSKRTEITQDMVLKELALIGFSDLAHYVDIVEDTGAIRAKGFEEMEEGKSRVLQSIEENRVIKEDAKGEQVTVYDKVKFKLWDKMKALDLIGKHLGMFIDAKIGLSDDVKVILERIFTDKRPEE